jgi:hypothetical protein
MPSPRSPLVIGNAQAFWGDDPDAPAHLVAQRPDLDCLTLDYLAEVSLSILAAQRANDSAAGYARDFLSVIQSLTPHWHQGGKTRVVANAGGLNPQECGRQCRNVLNAAGLGNRLRVGVVCGDDVLPALLADSEAAHFRHLETGQSAGEWRERFVTANAYLGAGGIAQAWREGADIIITGRVADPSLTVGPCLAHYGWRADDYARVAGATVAGHLIECGAQACGGFSTDWLDLPDPEAIGFPVIEIDEDGTSLLTKPAHTGGAVNLRTVREQLLYEIGDPGCYLSPDATVSLLGLHLEQAGPDRVRITGAIGSPPTDFYKVSATYRDGFRAAGMLTVYGRRAVEKARRCGESVLRRLREAGHAPERSLVECLGTGAAAGGLGNTIPEEAFIETVLRVSVADRRREVVEHFSRLMAPLVTAGPQGVTGYGVARPKAQPVFGYWPCLIPRGAIAGEVRLLDP